MIETKAKKIKIKAHALIRDKNGKPKIDDYDKCHDSIKALLTETEREEFENGTYTHNHS